MPHIEIETVRVFTCEDRGGNVCPIVLDANTMTPTGMQTVARDSGRESAFVLSAPNDDYDFSLRFWVPKHEMEMCGHATIGALWLLASKDMLTADEARINTLSGPVQGFVSRIADGSPKIEITQPAGDVQSLDIEATDNVLSILGLSSDDVLDLPIQNAVTSRIKTLVPVKSVERLNSLNPNPSAVKSLCEGIGSTGLYPYAAHSKGLPTFEARQFPRDSGYPEDAATGIAATALAFGLLSNGLIDRSSNTIKIMQGRAMGSLSEIHVKLDIVGDAVVGCLLGGRVVFESEIAN